MKKITLLLFMLSFAWFSFAQVGINTITPEASSALDIESTTGGILIPRLTEFQRDAIALPATGLMIYQTDKNPGFYFYSGTSWTKINGAAGPRGPQGVFGGASFEYQYGGVGSIDSGLDDGSVRFLSSDNQEEANQLQFSELDSNGDSVYSFVEMLSQTQSSTKGVVRLVNKFDTSKNLQFKITDIDFTNATGSSTPGYFIFDVENVASSSSNPFYDAGTFTPETPIIMSYSISGSDGLQGPQGEQGQEGQDGPSGQDGAVGATGEQGPQGEQGVQGEQGDQGEQGPQGDQGAQGIQGPIGLTGLTGPAGQDGANGINGEDGAVGATGATGPTGPQGAQGIQGEQGPEGPQGIQGDQGEQGIQGLTGLTGPAGQDGAQGQTGATGPQGIQGDQGEQGIQGPIGVTGPTGQDGTNGIDGVDGQSAYQIWLSRGNTGTEADFIASLTGPTGLQGAQGEQGIQGPIGLTGPQGIQGEQGIQGPQGPIGVTGPSGQDGANGINGEDGAVGATGAQGIQGPIGLTGATGPQGPQGIVGPDGQSAYQIWLSRGNTGTEADFIASLTGPTGLQGAQGEQGIQGPIGLTGPAGQDGADGADGAQGPIGPAGAQGPAGATGVAGPTGPPGTQGAPGNDGQDGENGQDGEDGLSAYEIWINAGNTGTEADFLASLVGPEGNTGSSLTGFKTITTFFDQTISVAPQSTMTGVIPNINTSHVIIKFIPDHINYHSIGIGIKCYDSNNVLLDLYVDEIKVRRDRYYSLSQDYTKVETFHYNTTYMTSSYGVVTGSNGGGTASGLGDFKIWSNGVIDRIEYTISHSNSNTNQNWVTRSPKLTVYKLQ